MASALRSIHLSGQGILTIILPPTSTLIVQKKRTAAQFFNDAETNGLESLIEANINSDKVSKHIKSSTKINYNQMLVLWDE